MKHLIVYAHPYNKSFNHAIKETAANTLRAAGEEVVIRDLYELKFDPVLSGEDIAGFKNGKTASDILTEQQYISWADVITFIYPIWWTGLPAIMKGYIDRVFSYGFAYKYEAGVQHGLLKGKKAVIINTQGKSHHEYQALGMDKALRLTSDRGIFEYCGFEVIHHAFLESVPVSTLEKREHWLNEIEELMKSIAVNA
ncbi:NAD(P)H-dependent oxidoreductase [Bacillus glycinifermentans]|uniref:NAD(P)H-dependent oxidoreductase n=1 Tax=Bacillus glycinifermentans TaxID=1664069 RepID=UPI002DBD29BF|nr:NAD(P)H-dependent oxidoreductase [Bacillus glycinifermentans]MEC3605656.1 NAD(P)H-dependent oxidoreductase [Bacillus glycinifermentans]